MYHDWIKRISAAGYERVSSEGAATSWTGGDGCTCTARCLHLSHECRAVTYGGKQYVLSEQSTFRDSPFGADGLDIDNTTVRPDLLYSYELVLWDANSSGAGAWTTLADLSDEFFDLFPHTMMQFPLAESYEALEVDGCSDATSDNVTRTMRTSNLYHVSSADLLDDLLVITLRNVNAIVAIDLDDGDIEWIIASPGAIAANSSKVLALGGASEAASASPAAPQESSFYEPHGLKLISKDKFFFIDDGQTRRDCRGDDDADADCWSRAIEMTVDTDAGTATITRQFEFPLHDESFSYASSGLANVEKSDAYNFIGGVFWPINPPVNDRYLIAFDSTANGPYYFWEVYFNGDDEDSIEVVAELETSDGHGLGMEGQYRATPITSIFGEAHEPTVKFTAGEV